MTQHQCKWHFVKPGSDVYSVIQGDDVHIALVDIKSNQSFGEIEINIERLLCFLEASVNCKDWYQVNDKGYFSEQNRTPLLMELEDNGDDIDYELTKLTGSYDYGKRKIFNREPLVAIKHSS